MLALELAEELLELLGRRDEQTALLERVLRRPLDAVEAEELARVLDRVDHVVDRTGEREEVVAVEGRDVLRVDQADQFARHAVALVLELLDLVLAHRGARELAETDLRLPRDLERRRGRAREQHVELVRPRAEGDHQKIPWIGQ